MKSLETFAFRAIPSLNKRLVLELTRAEYLDRRENVLALGNSGTGKTHLALALGLAACQTGYRVRFTTAAALVNELLEARDDKRLLRFQKLLAKQDLLIVDELGYVPLSKTGAQPAGSSCNNTSRRRAVREFVAHYHHERNHQGLDNRFILPLSTAPPPRVRVQCRQRLGGMLN